MAREGGACGDCGLGAGWDGWLYPRRFLMMERPQGGGELEEEEEEEHGATEGGGALRVRMAKHVDRGDGG